MPAQLLSRPNSSGPTHLWPSPFCSCTNTEPHHCLPDHRRTIHHAGFLGAWSRATSCRLHFPSSPVIKSIPPRRFNVENNEVNPHHRPSASWPLRSPCWPIKGTPSTSVMRRTSCYHFFHFFMPLGAQHQSSLLPTTPHRHRLISVAASLLVSHGEDRCDPVHLLMPPPWASGQRSVDVLTLWWALYSRRPTVYGRPMFSLWCV
jgi:hypothetical protein